MDGINDSNIVNRIVYFSGIYHTTKIRYRDRPSYSAPELNDVNEIEKFTKTKHLE